MKKHYEIVGFEYLTPVQLKPHPDVQLPMDDEDRVALGDSLGERGILQPLIVSATECEKGVRHIYEGVNRWRTYSEAGNVDEKLPCILVECDNPRELALTFLGIGRKRSTGQRIMAYLEAHKKEVLKVSEIVGDGLIQNRGKASAGHVTGGKLKGNLANFTAEAIAEKLHVSDKDVRLGIEVLQCIQQKTKATWERGTIRIGGQALDMENADDAKYYKSLKDIHLNLLAGSTPIRRWKNAVGGKTSGEGKTRPDTDYGGHARVAIRTLHNAIRNWKKIDIELRQAIANDWAELREAAAAVNLD